MKRVLIASLAAPLLAVLVGDAVCALLFGWGFGLFTLFGALIAYPLAWVLGVPFFLWIRRTRYFSLGTLVVGGVVLGALGWMLFFWPLSGPSFDLHASKYSVFALVAGIAGALSFWFMVQWEPREAGPHEL